MAGSNNTMTFWILALAGLMAVFLQWSLSNPVTYSSTTVEAGGTMTESFASFTPQMPCPATPGQILARINGIGPSRGSTGNRGLFACAGDNVELFPGNCDSC